MAVLVQPEDVRPARADGTCFYCRATLGEVHADSCVIPAVYVHVRVTLDLITEVPAANSKHDNEFRWNDGTWCVDNMIEALADRAENDELHCLCAYSRFDQIEVVDLIPHHGVNESVWRPSEVAYALGSPTDEESG